MSALVHVGLGANVGDVAATLRAAIMALSALPRTRWLATSSIYRTRPLDADGRDFLNAVAQLRTDLTPHELLAALHRIEAAHGRERPYRNAPRTLDLDLLLYGDEMVQSATLTVPHPRLHERAFVLVPLAELSPQAIVPGRGVVDSLLGGVANQSIHRIGSDPR